MHFFKISGKNILFASNKNGTKFTPYFFGYFELYFVFVFLWKSNTKPISKNFNKNWGGGNKILKVLLYSVADGRLFRSGLWLGLWNTWINYKTTITFHHGAAFSVGPQSFNRDWIQKESSSLFHDFCFLTVLWCLHATAGFRLTSNAFHRELAVFFSWVCE